MRKLLILNLSVACFITACNSGGSSTPASVCPTTAPMFTESLGVQLLNQWGTNVLAYSPYQTPTATYPSTYTGAAYFTGAQYTPDAVLLPTVSNQIREGSQSIYSYFTKFLAHGPMMVLNSESGGPYVTMAGCGTGVISGYYNFTYADGSPPTEARYTFQFNYAPTSQNIAIVVESGVESGTSIAITQAPGWYVDLQHSTGLPEN